MVTMDGIRTSLLEPGDLREDGEDGDEHARGTDALERTTKDLKDINTWSTENTDTYQDVHSRCKRTDEGANLEEDDAGEVHPFRGSNSEDLPKCQH